MTGWQLFWTLVGFVIFILVLIFLYFYQPFETLFTLILNGLAYDNVIFWAVILTAIVGFCLFHWQAYRQHIVTEQNIEAMVLGSLQGSTFVAILLSAGAALQSVQILCDHVLSTDYVLDADFGRSLAAILATVVLTGLFCVIFWLLKVVRGNREQTADL